MITFCPGVQKNTKLFRLWSRVQTACPGGGGSGSQNCPEGRGALTPRVSWGVEGSEKKCGPPEDNFWNSRKLVQSASKLDVQYYLLRNFPRNQPKSHLTG